MRFVVIYTTDTDTGVLAKVFSSREVARVFCRQLAIRTDVESYSMCRVGARLGSFVRNVEHTGTHD